MKAELEKVRELAKAELATGQEPPWAWFRYMKLVEVIDQILAAKTACSQESAERPEKHLRLVGSKHPPETAQPHPETIEIQLPM